jgi:hypothetical protein
MEPRLSYRSPRNRHPATALGTAQPSRPDQYRCFSAVLFGHLVAREERLSAGF